MPYQLLSSVFYQDKAKYDALYQNRFDSCSAYHLPVEIHGNPGFIMTTPEITSLIETIYIGNQLVNTLCDALPRIAVTQFINKNLIDEIMLTNDIEGVYSTRKEIKEILEAPEHSARKRKFSGLVHQYLKLLNYDNIPLDTSKHIREIYDEIVLNEISEEDYPDGKIFRKDPVSVYSVTDKERHKGISPEKELLKFMDSSLNFLKDSQELCYLIRVSLFHYLFGYAHPFYDGNGRTSRFISSYLLKKCLHELVSIRISYTINNEKNSYYKAFDICNDPKNKGDLTPFVQMFLNVIHKSTENICNALYEASEKLNHYVELLRTKTNADSEDVVRVIDLLIQDKLFGEGRIPIETITKHLEKSESSARMIVKNILENTSFPVYVERERNKHLYGIDLDRFDELFG